MGQRDEFAVCAVVSEIPHDAPFALLVVSFEPNLSTVLPHQRCDLAKVVDAHVYFFFEAHSGERVFCPPTKLLGVQRVAVIDHHDGIDHANDLMQDTKCPVIVVWKVNVRPVHRGVGCAFARGRESGFYDFDNRRSQIKAALRCPPVFDFDVSDFDGDNPAELVFHRSVTIAHVSLVLVPHVEVYIGSFAQVVDGFDLSHRHDADVERVFVLCVFDFIVRLRQRI